MEPEGGLEETPMIEPEGGGGKLVDEDVYKDLDKDSYKDEDANNSNEAPPF